jgi:alkylation response protein AidB-like acyl-CoA dehydrogenase
MDVHLSDDQILLQETTREFLKAECPIERVRAFMQDPGDPGGALWDQMAALGWIGLSLPQEYGGAGLDLLSLSLVCLVMGRVLLPEPYLSTVAQGAHAVTLAGSDEQKRRLLPAIAEGRLKLAMAWLEEDLTWQPSGITLAANATPDGFRFSGCKRFANDAQCADLLLVPVRTGGVDEDGISLLLVETDQPGVAIEPVLYTDQTRKVCEVHFDGVGVKSDAVLGEIGGAWPLLERVLDHAKVALCAEMLGGAERVLELSVEYVKQREQFDRPIGTFQAIQHKCTDQFVRVESMRSALYYAAWAVENGEPDAHRSACLAKSFCGDAYTAVAAEGIQIHGGLGFTWEQDLHLYYKRAKASELLFGDASWNRELAARELLDG